MAVTTLSAISSLVRLSFWASSRGGSGRGWTQSRPSPSQAPIRGTGPGVGGIGVVSTSVTSGIGGGGNSSTPG